MSRNLTKSFVEAATFVLVLLMFVGGYLAAFSVMLFDAPGSSDQPGTCALAISVVSFPVVCALAVVMSQRALKFNALPIAVMWVFVPLANVFLGGAAIAWIELVQGGKLNG